MHKESSLMREFRSKEVNRMRNLITGKSGDKTEISVGYEKTEGDKKEGDIWTDVFGKTWTIKNGIKQTVTKMDDLKKLTILPLACPKCKKTMKITDLNKKMYSIHECCFDCVVEMETKMKSEGTWKEYETKQINSNVKTSLEDFESAVDSWLQDKDSFVAENGDIETWSGGDKKKAYEEIKQNISKLKQQIT